MATIKADKVSSAILSLLEDYADDVEGATEKAIDATARQTVKNLKNYRPAGAEVYGSWDKYLAGWTSTSDKLSSYSYKRKVHNKTKYMLAHLLEHGHNDIHGNKFADPFVHIKIAEDKAAKLIESNIEKEIKKI